MPGITSEKKALVFRKNETQVLFGTPDWIRTSGL